MARIQVRTWIDAAADRCFDLARSQKAHVASTERTSEQIVQGPANDLLELGDRVTFEARHLGIRQRLTAEIVEFDRPTVFVDEMRQGAFQSLRHEHRFSTKVNGTEMIDTVEFRAPFGLIGRLAEVLFLTAYTRRFITRRAQGLQAMAEKERP